MSYAKSVDFLFNQMRNYAGTLGGGSVTFYTAGTDTLATIYLDRGMDTEAANPYMLSADGTAELFASGVFRIVVKNSAGVIVYDFDDVEIQSAITTGVSEGSTHSVINALTGDQTYTLLTTYNQIVSRTGESSYTVTISPPDGYTFADGTSTYVLYTDSETVEFLLAGTVYYLVP